MPERNEHKRVYDIDVSVSPFNELGEVLKSIFIHGTVECTGNAADVSHHPSIR